MSSTRPRQHALRRLLLVLLDTRGRWWMSAWIWLPMAAAVYIATASPMSWLDGWISVSGAIGFPVNRNGDDLVPAPSAMHSDERWGVSAFLSYKISHRHIQVEAVFRAVRMPSQVSETRPEYLDRLKALLLDKVTKHAHYIDGELFADWPEVRGWMADTWAHQILTDSTTPIGLPGPLRYRLAWIALRTSRAVALVLASLSILSAVLRGTQIGAYRRMLRRHEAGRCPHCDYDISAVPDQPCPECGCDHRARRQEAVRALEEANRRVR